MKVTKSSLRSIHSALLYSVGLAGYPLIAALSQFAGIENRPLSIAYRGAFFLLAVTYILVGLQRPREWYRGPLWICWFVFWPIYLWRCAELGLDGTDGLYADKAQDILLFALGSALIPSLAFLRAPKPEHLSSAAKWCTYSAAVATIGAGYLITVSGSQAPGAMARAALQSLNPISFGHLGASLGLLGAYYALWSPPRRRLLSRLVPYAAVGLGLIAAVASASRGPLLAFVVPLIITAITFKTRNAKVQRLSLKVGKAVGAAVLVGLVWVSLAFVQDEWGFKASSRVSSAVEDPYGDHAVEARFNAWAGATEQFLENPLVGDSIIERRTGFYPHSALLEGFMATGVVGGLPLAVWFAAVLVSALQLLRRGQAYAWISLLAIQYMIGAMFSGALWGNTLMWYFGAAAVSLAYVSRRNRHSTRVDQTIPRAASVVKQRVLQG